MNAKWVERANGFAAGMAITAVAAALMVTQWWLPAVHKNYSEAAALGQIQNARLRISMEQTAACQAKFQKATLLMEPAQGEYTGVRAAGELPLFHGFAALVPGPALRSIGGDESNTRGARGAAHPAWFIPADVEPMYYGDPNNVLVAHFDFASQQLSDTPHKPQHADHQ